MSFNSLEISKPSELMVAIVKGRRDLCSLLGAYPGVRFGEAALPPSTFNVPWPISYRDSSQLSE